MTSDGDPRTRRTIAAIKDSALGLLGKDGPGALTVSRLCRKAGVARSTFYEHFRLPWEPAFAALKDRFFARFPEYAGDDVLLDPDTLLASGKPLSYPIFAHVEEHAETYTRVFADEAGAGLIAAFEAAVAEISKKQHEAIRRLSTVTVDADLVAGYLAGAAIASCRRWLGRSPRPSPLEIAYWFSRMAVPGLFQVMGIEELLEQ